MKGQGIRCFVEVEVTAEHFIGAFTAQYHLDAHALDDAGKQVHRGGGAHGGHVVGLDVVDDITHGIQSLLDGIVDFVVYGTDVVGNFLGLGQVRGTFQSHGEAVELRPPRSGLPVGFDAVCRKLPRYGRNDGTVQSAGEQHAIGNVAHQLAAYGSFQGITYGFYLYGIAVSTVRDFSSVTGVMGIIVLHVRVVHPITGVPTRHLPFLATVIMSRQERIVFVAETFKCFQFAGQI